MIAQQSVRLLLVDPDRWVCAAVDRCIRGQQLPYVLETAGSQETAIERMGREDFDAVLLDGTNGKAFGMNVPLRWAAPPAILLVDRPCREAARCAMRLGACPWPVDTEDEDSWQLLSALVECVVRWKNELGDARLGERRYRQIVETTSEGIWIGDAENKTVFVNRRMAEIIGHTVDELIGTSMDAFVDDQRRALMQRKHGARRRGVGQQYDFRLRHKDGSERWVLISASALFDEDQFTGTLAMMTDITHRRRAEELLRLDDARLEALHRLNQMTEQSTEEVTDFVLEEAVRLTRSTMGFVGFLHENRSALTIENWSNAAMHECATPNKAVRTPFEKGGLCGRSALTRKPVVMNDYENLGPGEKGYSPGHVRIRRFLEIPVFDDQRVVAVAAVANKEDDYGESDVRQMTLLMEGLWQWIERRRTSEALRESEERFRSLFENTAIGVYRTTPDGRLLLANPAVVRMLGYSSFGEIAQRNLEEEGYAPGYPRSDFKRRIERDGQIAGLESAWVKCDGSTLFVRESAKAIRDEAGNTLHYEGTVEDITDRKRAEDALQRAHDELEERVEERTAMLKAINRELRQEIAQRKAAEQSLRQEEEQYRTLVETVPHGIAELDTRGRITFANSACHRIFDYDEGTLPGVAVWEHVEPPAERTKVREYFQELVKKKPEPTQYYAQASARTGRTVDARIDWDYKRDASGKLIGFVAVITDVTEQHRIEEQAQHHLGQLAHVERLSTMNEMVSGLAHELNQPLAAVSNYAQACRHQVQTLEGKDRDEVLEAVKQITEQADRAGQIIRRLREFVRRTAASRSTADINQLVRDVLVLLGVEMRLHDVQSELRLETPLPQTVVDRIQIEQVITNLVRNAVEAARELPKANRLVTIRTSLKSADWIEVAVRDTGKGFSPEDVDRVFEPFYTTKRDGMGLGLSISRSIIEAHGGRLEAAPDTTPPHSKQGTEFRFTLPVKSKGGPS